MTDFPFLLGTIPFGTTVDEQTSFAVRISTKVGARPRTPGERTLAGAEGLGA